MKSYVNIRKGLEKIYIGVIGSLICAFVAFIPVVGIILSTVGICAFMIMSISGYYSIGKDVEECKTAFVLLIIVNVISLANIVMNNGVGFMGTLIGDILSIVADYLLFYSVAKAFREQGKTMCADSCMRSMKIYMVCIIIEKVIERFFVTEEKILMAIAMLALAIISFLVKLNFLKDNGEEFGAYMSLFK